MAGIEEFLRRLQIKSAALPSDVGDRSHDALTGITTDNHHDELHAHDGGDGSGVILHGNLGDLADDDHFAYLKNAAVPSTPARAFNSTFTPAPLRAVLGIYTVRIQGGTSLVVNQVGRVELLSDAAAPPVTIRAQARLRVDAAVEAIRAIDVPLVYLVPPGHNVRLETTQESGAITFTLAQQTEVLL